MTIFSIVVAGTFVYILMGAVMAGYLHRVFGYRWNHKGPKFMAPYVWPPVMVGIMVWKLFIKPTVPIVRGVYRISAGMSWTPYEEDT